MRIGVFALQGAFIEHVRMLQRLGVEAFEIHSHSDWEKAKDGIILPGGESTTQIKLLRDLNMFDSVKIGMDYLKDKCDRFLFTPVDIPLFTCETVLKIMESRADLTIPVCGGKG